MRCRVFLGVVANLSWLLSCTPTPQAGVPTLIDASSPDSGSVDANTARDAQTDAGSCMLPSARSALHFYTSSDGRTFSGDALIYSRVSVPHILHDKSSDQYLVSFQIFEDPPLCDTMGFIKLSTSGTVLGPVSHLSVKSELVNGFDPTLLMVRDKLALVYTVRPPNKKQPCITVAIGSDISTLVQQKDLLWCSETDSEAYMDPAAIFIDPYLYVYTPSDASMSTGTPVSYYAKIDVSQWTIGASGKISNLSMFLLGSMVATGDSACAYRFYGTMQNQVRTACTQDGVTFTMGSDVLAGVDPGVARNSTGGYAMVIAAEP